MNQVGFFSVVLNQSGIIVFRGPTQWRDPQDNTSARARARRILNGKLDLPVSPAFA